MDGAIVFSYQLGMVDNCRPLSHLCYVIDAPHKKAKTPIWRKLGVANQQKRQCYLLVEPGQHPPHEVINHEAVFILSSAVVSVEVDFSFTKGMVFKKVVEHRYNRICPLPYVEALIDEIVDLKRVNRSHFVIMVINLVTNLSRDTLTANIKYGTFPGCQKILGARLQWIVRIVYLLTMHSKF